MSHLIAVKTETKTTRRCEIRLNGIDIINLLREHFKATGLDPAGLPMDATVTFSVPGGGDWSNTEIDISNAEPIIVKWDEVEVSES